ncbi:hypothetical protein AM587_10003553 [Phytophthora nicotianae]|uniref:Uncharacterized protein n=1 Tax=Phytophthora nicotianae TaxID=4792 RepID=A0A0W8CE17_PHYNI|nr:hypothetical protein AM587_10003553 [Phytophthora nicotianae]
MRSNSATERWQRVQIDAGKPLIDTLMAFYALVAVFDVDSTHLAGTFTGHRDTSVGNAVAIMIYSGCITAHFNHRFNGYPKRQNHKSIQK